MGNSDERVIMACEENLSVCILALVGALGAMVPAFIALVKAQAAHHRLDMRESEKKEDV